MRSKLSCRSAWCSAAPAIRSISRYVQCFPERYHERCVSVRAWHNSIATCRFFDIGAQPAVFGALSVLSRVDLGSPNSPQIYGRSLRIVQRRPSTSDRYIASCAVSADFGRGEQRFIQECHTRRSWTANTDQHCERDTFCWQSAPDMCTGKCEWLCV